MALVRVLAIGFVLLLLLAGCSSRPAGPVYEPPPFDVPAPPPTDDFGPVEFIEPAKGLPQVEVRGRVLDAEGRPIKGALLWAEGADLREPVNNLAAYEARRTETLLRTAADGAYRFVLDEGVFFLTVEAAGHHLHRFQPRLDKPVVVHDVAMVRDDIDIVGHRGAYYYAPENTQASFVKAHWLGIDIVEVDVRITRDGVLVIIHDRSLARTTGHAGDVHETRYGAMKSLDAGSWFDLSFAGQRIPTLDEVFTWAEQYDVGVVLDMKVPVDNATATESTWEGALDAIERWGFEERAIFGSFDADGVRACTSRGGYRCAFMTNNEARRPTVIADAQAMGADMVMLRRSMADAGLVAEARGAGIELHVWGLNTPTDWARMQGLGITSWGTDRPGYILDYLNGV